MKKYSFMDVPIGANKRFLVKCGGKPFAGFDKLSQAKMYVAVQLAKTKGNLGKEPAFAAKEIWNIEDTQN